MYLFKKKFYHQRKKIFFTTNNNKEDHNYNNYVCDLNTFNCFINKTKVHMNTYLLIIDRYTCIPIDSRWSEKNKFEKNKKGTNYLYGDER